MVNKKIVIKTR